MKITFFTKYAKNGASSRLRSCQYFPLLEQLGCEIEWHPLFSDQYLDRLYKGKLVFLHVIWAYLRRIVQLIFLKKCDLVVIEKELFPWVPYWFEQLFLFKRTPYALDYDDAIFHTYDANKAKWIRYLLGTKIDRLMKHSHLVVAGNDYLAERARAAGAPRVEIVPTVVDIKRYEVKSNAISAANRKLTVGWIGTPMTTKFLLEIKPVIDYIVSHYNVEFVAVGASKSMLSGMQVSVLPWSEDTEAKIIESFDLGLMPLSNSVWDKGKCGYKLIQYMACGVPVLASPVGVNVDIVKDGVNGYLCANLEEWKANLILFCEKKTPCNLGDNARKMVEQWYCLDAQIVRIYSMYKSVIFE